MNTIVNKVNNLIAYKETIRDSAILLNEGWLYIFAKKMREAESF